MKQILNFLSTEKFFFYVFIGLFATDFICILAMGEDSFMASMAQSIWIIFCISRFAWLMCTLMIQSFPRNKETFLVFIIILWFVIMQKYIMNSESPQILLIITAIFTVITLVIFFMKNFTNVRTFSENQRKRRGK